MICSTTGKNKTSYSSDILRVPKKSHCEAKKNVTIRICVTIWGVTISQIKSPLSIVKANLFLRKNIIFRLLLNLELYAEKLRGAKVDENVQSGSVANLSSS